MIKQIIVVFVFLVFFSCKSLPDDTDLNKKITLCIEKSSTEYAEGLFNIYEYYTVIEQILFKEKFLNGKSKMSYKKLIQDLHMAPKMDEKYLQLYKQISDKLKYPYKLVNPGVLQSPFNCVRFFLKTKGFESNTYYSNYYTSLNKLYKSGLVDDLNLNINLIENTPKEKLSNIIYKAPILAVFYENLEYYIEENFGLVGNDIIKN